MGILTRGGTTQQRAFVKSGLSKKKWRAKKHQEYLERTGKAKSGDRAGTYDWGSQDPQGDSITLPEPPDKYSGWTPEYGPDGRVRFVSGDASTQWRTLDEWKKATLEEERQAVIREKVKKDPEKFVKTYIGRSGTRKIEKRTGKIVTTTKSGVYLTPRQETEQNLGEIQQDVRFLMGTAGFTQLTTSKGLTEKMQRQMPEIQEVYRKESRTLGDIRREEGWVVFLKTLDREIAMKIARGLQKTQEMPLQSIKEALDPKTVDLGIKRSLVGIQQIMGIHHVQDPYYFQRDKKVIAYTSFDWLAKLPGFEKVKSMSSKDLAEKGVTKVMDDLNKQFKELTPVGKIASFGYGIGALKVATLPFGYFASPTVKTGFHETIKDKKTSTAQMRSTYGKKTFFEQKPVDTYSLAKIKDSIARGVAETIRKVKGHTAVKSDAYYFRTQSHPYTARSYPSKIGWLRQEYQRGTGEIVKIFKAFKDPIGQIKIKILKVKPHDVKHFKFGAEETFLPQDFTKAVTGKGDPFSLMRGSTKGLDKPFMGGDFGGVRKYIDSSLVKDFKGGDLIIQQGKGGAMTITQDLSTQTAQTLKSASQGVAKALKTIQDPLISDMVTKVALQESAVYGVMASGSLKTGSKTDQLFKDVVIPKVDVSLDLGVKDTIKDDQTLKISGKEVEKSISKLFSDVSTDPRQESLTKSTPKPDIITDVDLTPVVVTDVGQGLKQDVKIREVVLSKTLLRDGPPPPPPPQINILRGGIGGFLLPKSIIDDEVKDYELFRGFKEFDLSKILKGGDVLKDVKLPKIKI